MRHIKQRVEKRLHSTEHDIDMQPTRQHELLYMILHETVTKKGTYFQVSL